MKKLFISLFWLFLGSLIFLGNSTFAYPGSSKYQEDRYILLISEERELENPQVPALVLDRVKGVVWVCQDIADSESLWTQIDLGQNEDRGLLQKKYIARIFEIEDDDLRIAATVLDTEEGVVWTCSNIIDNEAPWIQKDLRSNIGKAVPQRNGGRIKIELD